MPLTHKKNVSYDDLYSIPVNMIGEIIDGELLTQPRPSFRHSNVTTVLTYTIGGPFQWGKDGPGGWIFLFEPEICLGTDILVPDIAGWKKERLPKPPEKNFTTVRPDWVCEVMSAGTVRIDRIKKMPIYGRFGIPYIWLIDPLAKTLEVFRLDEGKWVLSSVHSDNDKIRAEPFQETEISLEHLWWD